MQTEALFDTAFAEHQAGNLDRANLLYRQVINANPRHADALHLVGLLAYQQNRPVAAEEFICRALAVKRSAAYFGSLGLVQAAQGKLDAAIMAYQHAIDLRADFAEGHNNLANALLQLGRIDEAIAAYRKAISVRPDFNEAHNNLGLCLAAAGRTAEAIATFTHAIAILPLAAEPRNHLAACHDRLGDIDKAIACWREALALRPDYADAWNNLGNALMRQGDLDGATGAFEQALAIQPKLVEAFNNLGVIHFTRRRIDDAIAAYRLALDARPDYADAHFNLAIALHEAQDTSGALVACRKAIALRPDWAEAHNNLGIWLAESGHAAAAVEAYDSALAIRGAYPEAHSNRGNALRQLGRTNDAVIAFERSIALNPASAEAHNNLGNVLKQLGRLDEAISSFRTALSLDSRRAEVHNNLANVLKDQGNLSEALRCYDRAIELRPDDPALLSNRLYTLHFHPDYSPRRIAAEHQQWNQRHAEPLRFKIEPPEVDRSANRRLRIGYIAPDFREHCQSLFTLPLLSNHDRGGFEIFCYSDVAQADAVTTRLQHHADAWRHIVGMSDPQVAELIRGDKIDILVDLTVHMAFNRLRVLAMKPAPVQATWLGYPGTTGVEAVDYRISDPYLDPPGEDSTCCEKTIHLPDTFWCYDPMAAGPKVNPLPAASSDFITFGCLNNFCKVNDATLELWAEVMREVPDSRLLLLAPAGSARPRVLDVLGQAGIAPTRIDFVGRHSRPAYLSLYHLVDIGLDTFPYNGHTTTLDAMWMGVPVVTRMGRSAVGRAGFSQLSNLGLLELCGDDDAGLVQIATALAGDLPRLADLRSTLRQRLQDSPLMDGPRFARGMEQCYRRMWSEWASGALAPAEVRPTLQLADTVRRGAPRKGLQRAS